MKTKLLNDFYECLEEELNIDYVNALKELINTDKLDEDSLEKLIKEVI